MKERDVVGNIGREEEGKDVRRKGREIKRMVTRGRTGKKRKRGMRK